MFFKVESLRESINTIEIYIMEKGKSLAKYFPLVQLVGTVLITAHMVGNKINYLFNNTFILYLLIKIYLFLATCWHSLA